MGVITKQQATAILKGVRMFSTSAGVTVQTSVKWNGVFYKDLFNPAGINLTNAAAATPVYPYVPGSGDPASQVFTLNTSTTDTIIDATTSNNVLIMYNGGNINTTANLQAFERDYHLTGLRIQKKLK